MQSINVNKIKFSTLTKTLLLSSILLLSAISASPLTLYVNGQPVSQKIINETLDQYKKSSPMAAMQMNNPQFLKQVYQSIGMQQALLLEGTKRHITQSKSYQAKLQSMQPMLYAQVIQDQLLAAPITDAQMKAQYDQMKTASANKKQYNVSHILVKDLKTANDIEAQLKAGANFATLATKYSMDPGSKAHGGSLGWSDGTTYVPEFTQALMKLHTGQYTTTPVQSQFGYHIIKLDGEKAAATTLTPLDNKMKDQIKQKIQSEKVRNYFAGLKTQYNIQVK